MAHGTPVIAYGKGGALETVISVLTPTLSQEEKGQAATGLFFMEQTPESLNAAIKQFETMSFESEVIKKHAARFSKEIFQEKLVRFIGERLQEKKS